MPKKFDPTKMSNIFIEFEIERKNYTSLDILIFLCLYILLRVLNFMHTFVEPWMCGSFVELCN